MAEKTAKNGKKVSALRWRGELADGSRTMRVTVAIILVVASTSFAFAQMGFIFFSLPGGDTAYVVTLLVTTALAALLLGTLHAVIVGALAGSALCLHAYLMPLDYYELTFVTPITAVFMLAVSGLLLGIFFAAALRNNPPIPRRIIYIVLVSFVISWLYSVGFAINVFIALIFQIVATAEQTASEAQISADTQVAVASTVVRLGSVRMQALLTAIFMALACSIADYLVCKLREHKEPLGLRVQFGGWLSVVVVIFFLVMSALSFVSITEEKLHDAESLMRSEVTYLCKQIEAEDLQREALSDFIDHLGVDLTAINQEAEDALTSYQKQGALLNGYTTEEDGTIIVTSGPYIAITDDNRFAVGDEISNISYGMNAAIAKCLETDEMQRFVFDGVPETGSDSIMSSLTSGSAYIGYLYAQKSPATLMNEDCTVIMMMPGRQVFAERDHVMALSTLSQLGLMAAVFLMVFQLLNKMVARRIDETNGVLSKVTEGNLDARITIHDSREFDSLSRGINETVDALKDWIHEAETRMDAELATAKAIQEAALPRIFPPYPDILRFDIYASMNAAREVGGDFYDFFLIGDDCTAEGGKLGFVVADVSGKGVPAALFMMKAMTQIRDYLSSGMAPGEAIENANRQLCDGNDADMFVTAWVGVLDYGTFHVDFVNAGHNPPLLWQRDGGWRWLKEKSGLPLGLFDGLPYKTYAIDCEIGDQFLLYTDGVTEAMNVDEELFGEDRLKELADRHFTSHPRALIGNARHKVALFAAGAEQSDDITLLALEVGVPPEVTASITVRANDRELPRVNQFIHNELDRRLCPLHAQSQLDIAVEELFVNAAHYAYPDATPEDPGTVRISYTYSAEPPSIQVDIVDQGIPYNPLEKPDAVTPDNIADVPIGGLGILMAKKSVDEMLYRREGDSNIVTIIKKW